MKSGQKSKNNRKRIYLDHASSTPVLPEVFAVLREAEKEVFGNPSAFHKEGVEAARALSRARQDTARMLDVLPDEIIFTSGGTESNNLAIIGTITNYARPASSPFGRELRITKEKPNIVTTNIEHASILETCRFLEKTGRATVTYVPVEKNGIVDPKKIREALKKNTVLVSVMYANNEIGTIQPIREIAKQIRNYRKSKSETNPKSKNSKFEIRASDFEKYPIFHVDACQATNYLPLRLPTLGVDLMTINGSKIYGPKGIGILVKKRGTLLSRMLHGGNQEFGLRAGTENIPLSLAFAKALEIALHDQEKESKRLEKLNSFFVNELKKISEVSLNGDRSARLPNIVNCTIPHFGSELLVTYLDARGIAVSSKSACKSDEPEASHVLRAISERELESDIGSIRFSMGRGTTKDDVKTVIRELKDILKLLGSIK